MPSSGSACQTTVAAPLAGAAGLGSGDGESSNVGGQAVAVDELHGEVVGLVVLADSQDGDDVGVLQQGGRLDLVMEALQMALVQRRGRRQYLDRDVPAQRNLLGLEHDAHAAPADLA